jgi:hypothetical protein
MNTAAILQDYLDTVGSSVMADDWAAYRECILLPCHVVSFSLNKVITDEDDLRRGFVEFRDTLRFHRVTDYIRLVERADLMDDALLSGSYFSHLLCNGHRLLEPFRSQITLRQIGGRWKAVSVTNGLANSRWATAAKGQPMEHETKGPDQ